MTVDMSKEDCCLTTGSCTGVEIGAVSIKWIELHADGSCSVDVRRHAGDPHSVLHEIISAKGSNADRHVVAVGETAQSLLDVAGRSETECIEKALASLDMRPDILLSLGGETFSLYTVKNGIIKNISSTDKCAAGTGEFLVQQFNRMDLTLEEGIEKSRSGKTVKLATRCSVHCKSDATHKLNKGECGTADIAASLVYDLARKIQRMIESSQWPSERIVVIGGVSGNGPFIAKLSELLGGKEITVLEQSPFLEAFGGAFLARELADAELAPPAGQWLRLKEFSLAFLKPLEDASGLLDYRVKPRGERTVSAEDSYILGVDAGSTTTKAVLYNIAKDTVDASVYLRTHGNPVLATKNCLQELLSQAKGIRPNIVQAGSTGSGREMVSVYLDGCPSLNEILSHARAAAKEAPEVDTVFEIGGQDSKFISFAKGIPVDYAMNEGCSAGTGSFLEEAASADLNVPVTRISDLAEKSRQPIAFGERCAAFINTDLRSALQQGGETEDVIGGLVYSIADNYISRIVGARAVGKHILFQGGVALNRSVGLAMAARLGKNIIVPPYPELMGAVGTCLMVKDLLDKNELERRAYRMESLLEGEIGIDTTFTCKTCDNFCEIQMISVRGNRFPFGGLCSKYDNERHKTKGLKEGTDLVAIRNDLIFKEFGVRQPVRPRGKIGLAMALTAYEMFPFFASLINGLGYELVMSDICKEGNEKTMATVCYPAQIAHGALHDLKDKGVDFIFLPNVVTLIAEPGFPFSFACGTTGMVGDMVRNQYKHIQQKIFAPALLFATPLQIEGTAAELVRHLSPALNIPAEEVVAAFHKAIAHQRAFMAALEQRGSSELAKIAGEPTVILAGRPYTVCAQEVNFALPKKITSRGYHVISADMLPTPPPGMHPMNTWRFTQQIMKAVTYAKSTPNFYVCLVSAYNCAPDVSIYHGVRQELAGTTYCYLEIDSHTAHAGVETRVGAFLDIIGSSARNTRDSQEGRSL
ncbi:MAG: acyl-CoA dehydratase activase [Desulfuromonadaceae bacterium]|nr:acyl-CoA dehydratase activase [Desulfuromonadaceae bacterium]